MTDDKSQLVKPIIRVIIALIALGVINFIILRLPGLTRINIPGLMLPYSIPAIISAIIATIMILIVLKFGFDFGPTVQRAYPTFPEMRTVAMNAVYLVAIVIAYTSYQPIILPFLMPDDWIYHLVFFIAALIPAYIIASTLMKNIDKWTGHIYTNVKEATGGFIDCQKCGVRNDTTNQFCKACGAKLVSTVFCMDCGAQISPNTKFCPKCGKEHKA